jgi:O-antigen/teichoic acid export membrane protein
MHYSLDNLRLSLQHFFVGKAASAITGLLLMVLLARWLPKADYAVYISLQALLVIVSYVTSFGISQTLFRYMPELRTANNNLPMYRMIARAFLSRLLVIGSGLLLIWALLPLLSQAFAMTRWQDWIPLYLLVGWLRLSGEFLSRVMETLLWQKQSQYILALNSLLRLSLVLSAAVLASVNIPTLFFIELASEILTLGLLLAGYVWKWRADTRRGMGDPNWWRTNRARSRRYALWSYLSTLAALFSGSAPYRLVAAKLLAPEVVALYGFASGLMDSVNHYTPTRLMQGTIRTILVARYSESGRQDDLILRLGLNFRVNAMILVILGALTLSSSRPVLDWLTSGKYDGADLLLAALIGVLLLDVLRAQMDLLAEVTERNQWALAGNLALAAGVFVAPLLASWLGAWGLIIAAGIGEAVALVITLSGLGVYGSAMFDARFFALLTGLSCAGWLGRLLSGPGNLEFAFSTVVTLASCGLLICLFPPFSKNELSAAKRLIVPQFSKD